ncbi:MAG TPA: ATP-binding protein [Polyangiaceae bacterium]|nr:ATP-binding protein [Polyangiaceae bacterium]
MPSDPAIFEHLTSKAMLLLRRERELFGLRVERTRIEHWIKVFHGLALNPSLRTTTAVVQEWAELMVGELNFQVAAVYHLRAQAKKLELQCSQSHVPLPHDLELRPDLLGFLTTNPSGHYRRREPSEMEELARDLGLETLFWLRLTSQSGELLLLCGFAPSVSRTQKLNDYDFSHFRLSAKHLTTLLDNIALIEELDCERSELAQSNRQLEQALEKLRKEMSDRLQLERELRHAQKLEDLGRMVAGIGHEINNPLAYVLSNLQFVRDEIAAATFAGGEPTRQAINDAIEEAIAGGDRIRSIVNATRQFSKPLEEPPKPIELAPSLAAVLRMVSNELRHRAKYTEVIEAVPRVIADPHRLEQVFVNLLVNAVHALPYGPAQNEIRLTCTRENDSFVVIRIVDTGQGISESDLDRVFEPFFSTRAQGSGLGLGLWICRGIIESFGGRIELASKVGCGTTASVYLRVAPGAIESTPAQAKTTQLSLPAGRQARILLIDDEPAVLRGLARVLKGHQVVMTDDGRNALETYKSGDFDIVFCDVMMPGFSGMEFVQELEKLGSEHARRVVLMTGGVDHEDIREFIAKSGNRCLSKPFETEKLQQCIRRALSGAGRTSAAQEGIARSRD